MFAKFAPDNMEFAMTGRSLWADREGQETTPPEVVAAIEGAHLVLEWLGAWPAFDDFEIISLQFDRGNLMKVFETRVWSEIVHPSLTVVFYGFDVRYSPDEPNRKPMLITMRFHGTFGRFALDGFNHQNPIVGLEIIFEYSENLEKNVFAVDWGGTGMHHEASFSCERVEVLSVEEFVA